MGLLVGFFLLSIVFSFLCSIWEAVLLSITPSYTKRLETENPSVGKLITKLKNDVDKPLSAILTLNTIAHTVGAIGVGAQAGKIFGEKSIDILGFHLTYESIIAALMTLAILFLSEIIPKTIGANFWKSLAPFTAKSLNLLLVILKPFVWLSTLVTKALKKDKDKSVFSKQDFVAMTDVVAESGEIEHGDVKLIKNVLKFDALTAEDVMTPRPVIVRADEDLTLNEFYEQFKSTAFSRVPVYKNDMEKMTGVVLKDDVYKAIIDGKGDDVLTSIKREAMIVHEKSTLRKVFLLLNENRAHMALVLDEYGSLSGLVTLEDIVETIFGIEIMDETDDISDLQGFARKKWEERAKKLGLID